MKLLDLSLSSPAENLALDEALLDACEQSGQEVLRFWESEILFVVLGYSNKADDELYRQACQDQNVPVLRRISGGGTVLQGPGCLNYSLTLHIPKDSTSPLHSVTGTNHSVMTRLRVGLAKGLHRPVAVEGHTDLAIDGLKFSGNAQRRRLKSILFHGTLLYSFDLEKVESFLKPPPRQPEYRQNRSHRQFIQNLDTDEGTLKSILTHVWKASDSSAVRPPREETKKLVEEKYSKNEWNFKF